MAMSDVLREWLEEITGDEITICDDPQVEARDNQWTFSISSEQVLEVAIEDFTRFINDVLHVKRLEVERRQLPSLIFYSWFDQISGRLCFSFTSRTDPAKLDFKCIVNHRAKLSNVLEQFLTSKHLDGIPLEEFTEESPIPSIASQDDQTPNLDVFVTQV